MRDFSPFSGPVSSYVSFLFHQCSWVFGGGDGSGGGGGVRVQWWLQPSVLPVVQVSTTGWIFSRDLPLQLGGSVRFFPPLSVRY